MQITVLCWNFERNGADDPAKRLRAHEKLVSLNPHLVFRQEMWGADANGNAIMYELEDVLGLRGWLGPQSCTAVFADPRVFRTLREWPNTGPMWVLPPTALTMRYLPAGNEAIPLAVASYHLNYASPTNRLAEAEWLSTWADKKWTTPDGETVRMPALFGGDNNGYPAPGLDGDLALPELAKINDQPHRLHRSYIGPNGTRLMDTRPDEALRTAGMEDVARQWATARGGDKTAVSRTVNACETHGPDSRIDRIYVTTDLLDAVTGVDVIEVPLDLSDHHIVRLTLDGERLSDILNRQPIEVAA
ncbi:endonuclease/exonuclease/phosphatase family protein [Streptomyces coffeae]|uniref:Endonuclease/exonuclease/phosphatase family protein n=1 Tax=Streptomyces coffeae TaxID=621382 RepID=A0ABS1NHY2_9ACTN|nr:endonuclease/exonuclease/phosphatase family protein [Streptomyces coffeae]MBL1099505.1 endonuclease/exonuclease/phosphatase family protein [Streptomyces coffeae]